MRISALTYSRLPGRGIVLCAGSMKSQIQEIYANADAVWRRGDRESGRDGKGGKESFSLGRCRFLGPVFVFKVVNDSVAS